MKKLFLLLVISAFTNPIFAQETLKLWDGDIPFSNGIIGEEEYTDKGHVQNIQDPTITIYLPKKSKATGAAVVICPGGGYRVLAIRHEGHDVAARVQNHRQVELGEALAHLVYGVTESGGFMQLT